MTDHYTEDHRKTCELITRWINTHHAELKAHGITWHAGEDSHKVLARTLPVLSTLLKDTRHPLSVAMGDDREWAWLDHPDQGTTTILHRTGFYFEAAGVFMGILLRPEHRQHCIAIATAAQACIDQGLTGRHMAESTRTNGTYMVRFIAL